SDDRGPVARRDDRSLDQLRLRREKRDPAAALGGGLRGELDAQSRGVGRTRDVPRLEAESSEHVLDVLNGRRVLQVAADDVLTPGRVQLRDSCAALGAGRIDPDLD